MSIQDSVDNTLVQFGFMDTDSFPGSEAIVYTTPGPSPTTRNITAQVIRAEPSTDPQSSKILRPRLTVIVNNSATLGVASSESFIGGKFTVAIRKGHATTKQHQIRQESLTSHDAGALKFEFGE